MTGNIRADIYFIKRAYGWAPIEKQDPLDELFGMPHFGYGTRAYDLLELAIAPVLRHLRMDNILVDCRQFIRQQPIKPRYQFFIALHFYALPFGGFPPD
jgi:hypothetical protein